MTFQHSIRKTILAVAIPVVLGVAPVAHAAAPQQNGLVPPEVTQAFEDGLFRLPPHPRTATSSAQTVWRVPIIMVSYTDDTLRTSAQEFNFALFDSTHSTPYGSVFDYYRWVSGGRLTVTGNVVAVVQLPHDRAYYGSGAWGLNTTSTPGNLYGCIRDALQQCQAQVKWSDYDLDHDGYVDMVWLLHAGHGGEAGLDRNSAWSITSRMSGGWRFGTAYITNELVPGSSSQYMRIDRFSSVPELSTVNHALRSEIGVFCHEFGHALGLPDLYDTSSLGSAANVGPGNWSLMSTGGYGTNGITPDHPGHIGAWPMVFLGWSTPQNPTRDTTLTLQPIELSGAVTQLWFQGEPGAEHFLIENRQPIGSDQYLPSPGLIVTHVDDAVIGARLEANRINTGPTPGLQVVEADGDYDLFSGRNRGDAMDPFPGAGGKTSWDDGTIPNTLTFNGAPTNIGLSSISLQGTDVRFHAQVRGRAWQPIEDHTDGGYQPVNSGVSATTATVDSTGTLNVVGSEVRAGQPQVVLRQRRHGMWEAAVTVSASSGGAYDPTLAQLPNGDLFVAWRDQRGGIPRIYSRAWIHGSWTAEQPVAGVPDNSFQPAIAADAHGFVHLAWLTILAGIPRVETMRFAYSSPFGIPVALTDTTSYPDGPSVAASANGHAYVLWPDRAPSVVTLRFARFTPDSGRFPPLTLAPVDGHSQSSVSAAVGPDGSLHAVWQEIGSGGAELHYQRRPFGAGMTQPDTTLEFLAGGVVSPQIAVDSQDGIHVAFETSNGGVSEIRYKRRAPGTNWDAVSTQVTQPSDGQARLPRLLPRGPGNLTVLMVGSPLGVPRFFTRDRWLDGPTQVTDVASPPEPASGLRLAPNPWRGGAQLSMTWNGAGRGGAWVDLFDLAGRRVAAVPLAGTGTTRTARLESSTTSNWPAGLYFARVRGATAATRLVLIR